MVLVPALLAGCSSGDEKPGAEKARYIEQSDAICRDAFAQAAGIGSGHDEATAQKGADVWGAASGKLKALAVPRESEEQARQFVTDVENLSLAYTAAARGANVGNQGRVDKSFTEITDIKKRAAEVADEYGYKVCKNIGAT
jgi:hypothetical protein